MASQDVDKRLKTYRLRLLPDERSVRVLESSFVQANFGCLRLVVDERFRSDVCQTQQRGRTGQLSCRDRKANERSRSPSSPSSPSPSPSSFKNFAPGGQA